MLDFSILSPKELEVVKRTAEGFSPTEIGEAMGISKATALNHLLNAKCKFKGIHTTRKFIFHYWQSIHPNLVIVCHREMYINDEQKQILSLVSLGLTIEEIALILDLTVNAVTFQIKKLKLMFAADSLINLARIWLQKINPGFMN